MIRPKIGLLAVSAAVLAVATGCGNSSTSSPSTPSSGPTYTIGVLADQTGPGASLTKTLMSGIKAGTALASKQGLTLKYVVVDTGTSPAGTLSGAQRLVQQDHVLAVISTSALGFTASPYLNSHGIPVVGGATSPEWNTDKNMFSIYGPVDPTKPATTFGKIMRMAGATNVAVVSYALPNFQAAVKANATSAATAGLRAGYRNPNVPIGSTNVQPIALGMKSAGVDGLTSLTEPSTNLALVKAARQAGVNLKVALLPTGYGGDLLDTGAGALRIAQGVYFLSAFQPVEMQTAATRQFQSALRSVGVTSEPTYAQYTGYASVDLLVRGFKAAGLNPTSAKLIKGLASIKDYSAAGLLGSHTLDLSQRTPVAYGPDNCTYVTKFSGSRFALVTGATPICGVSIPN